MAEDDKTDPDGRGAAADVVEAVRGAVERTLHATAGSAQTTRERAQGLVDEIASAASRVRGAFEERTVGAELSSLRAEVDRLSREVAELERRSPGAGPDAGGGPATTSTQTAGAATAGRPVASPDAQRRSARSAPADDASPGRS